MRSKVMLKDYFKAITNVASQGDAREESFYTCLETLLFVSIKTSETSVRIWNVIHNPLSYSPTGNAEG